MNQLVNSTFANHRSPEDYRSWLAGRHESEDLKAIALRAISLYVRAKEEPNSSDQFLDELLTAAAHPRFVVWEVALPLLAELAECSAASRTRIRALASNKDSELRRRSIQYINDNYPRDFCVDLLRLMLTDRSSRVRGFAAGRIESLNLVELLPLMDEALSREKNAATRFEIEFSMCLLRDNHFEYDNHNGYNLVLRFADNWPRQIVWPGGLTREEVRAVGVDCIRDQVRESPGFKDWIADGRPWAWEIKQGQYAD